MPKHADDDSSLEALLRASRAFSGVVAASLAQVGDQITPQQLRVLVIIGTRDRVKASDISHALDIHPSSATRLCDKLVTGAWIDRRVDPDDRRQVALHLTHNGSALLATVMDHRRRDLQRVLDALTPRDRDNLNRCLTLISDALGEPHEGAWHLDEHQP